MRSAWFAMLLAAICFEGIARKFMSEVPGVVFYFAKDAVLVAGLFVFGIPREAIRTARHLFRGFSPFLLVAFFWTVVEMLNPLQQRPEFAILGLRAYWMWWLAPFVIASALRAERDRGRAMLTLGGVAIAVAALALVQFTLPPSHPLNQYAAADMDVAIVGSTGRPRVTSTFSYLTGFTDFVVLVPAILLSVGLATKSTLRKIVLFVATVLSAMALPASGARAPVLLGLGALVIVAYAAGVLWTRNGRRVVLVGAISLIATALLASTAIEGVRDRFVEDPAETQGRLARSLIAIPPLALTLDEYATFGSGTGTHQNAATIYDPTHRWVEEEPFRILLEQGVPGYLLISVVRVGLVIALLRGGSFLKRSGMRAEAGAAWALAALAFPLNLVFDHIFQALFFVAAGIVLESIVRARTRAPARTAF